jgi:hypothetical protein
MRMLYKYPQAAFPYRELVEENRRRGMAEPEFELLDTGVFANGCYFDIGIEYGKADPDDILMRVTICNRAAEAAKLHVLPQLWARNIWSWQPRAPKPLLRAGEDGAIAVEHPQLPPLRLYCDGRPELLFCENETNFRRLYGINSAAGTCKDGINDYIVCSYHEGLYRNFTNRLDVAAYAGLVPTPWRSGSIDREQGVSKAGNPRLRHIMIELAWLWLRHQPGSALSGWFRARVGNERGRIRRITIVALARKLLIALWRYVTQGEVPEGAVLKAA